MFFESTLSRWLKLRRDLAPRRRANPLPPVVAAEVRCLMSGLTIVPRSITDAAAIASPSDGSTAAANSPAFSMLPNAFNQTLETINRLVGSIRSLGTTQATQAPGESNQVVTISVGRVHGRRHHTYEMGVILVDDATGKIGSLSPGDSGYAKAA